MDTDQEGAGQGFHFTREGFWAYPLPPLPPCGTGRPEEHRLNRLQRQQRPACAQADYENDAVVVFVRKHAVAGSSLRSAERLGFSGCNPPLAMTAESVRTSGV